MSGHRIWVDMTDMANWNGHLTGIQRVVYQLGKRYGKTEKNVHYFVYNDVARVFTEINFEDIKRIVETPPEQAQASVPSFKQKLKGIPKTLFSRLPVKVKERVPESVKHGAKRAIHMAIHSLKRGKYIITSYLPAGTSAAVTQIAFESTDTVIAFGKVWDKPNLVPDLAKIKRNIGFKVVFLIHDMIPSMQPHLFGPGLFEPYTRTMFEAFQMCDALIANSKASKRDIAAFCEKLHIKTPETTVVRIGDEILANKLPADFTAPDHRLKPGNFILQVGTVELRKNHLLGYQAYREAAMKGDDMPYWVIVGGRGWLVGDLIHQMEYDPLVKDKIVILWGPDDEKLLWLYKNCRFTIYPSTYEGWGMPVSESLAYGKVCITSNTSSLPEAGGGFADEISPYNADALYKKIKHYMNDDALKAKEKEIAKNFKPGTWDNMFKQCDEVIINLRKS